MADMNTVAPWPVILAVQSSAAVNHAHEHVNILEYTEYFRAYMDLGYQGATNTGEMIHR